MEFEQDDVILCTVDKIVGTTVFVNIAGTTKTGSLTFSEVAPGRIRNIRDYVVPKKTIVCKILKISSNNIELSLRRVKEKERKEVIGQYKIEKSYRAILKSILKEKTSKIVEKIRESNTLYGFLENAKKDSTELEILTGKENSEKILEILNNQKKKTSFVNKEVEISYYKYNGLTIIKEILSGITEAEVKYLAAGKYVFKKEGSDLKTTDIELTSIISKVEEKAKNNNVNFRIK
jgi:translation initiation factor 2 alpha subunit (eIF-2alpha)